MVKLLGSLVTVALMSSTAFASPSQSSVDPLNAQPSIKVVKLAAGSTALDKILNDNRRSFPIAQAKDLFNTKPQAQQQYAGTCVVYCMDFGDGFPSCHTDPTDILCWRFNR